MPLTQGAGNGIQTFPRQQLFVAAGFDEAAVVEGKDLVGGEDGLAMMR